MGQTYEQLTVHAIVEGMRKCFPPTADERLYFQGQLSVLYMLGWIGYDEYEQLLAEMSITRTED